MGFHLSKMKIFKDAFSGDELFSDTYPIKLVEDCIYEVTGKHETRTEGEIQEGLHGLPEGLHEEGGQVSRGNRQGRRGRHIQEEHQRCDEGSVRKIQGSLLLHWREYGR